MYARLKHPDLKKLQRLRKPSPPGYHATRRRTRQHCYASCEAGSQACGRRGNPWHGGRAHHRQADRGARSRRPYRPGIRSPSARPRRPKTRPVPRPRRRRARTRSRARDHRQGDDSKHHKPGANYVAELDSVEAAMKEGKAGHPLVKGHVAQVVADVKEMVADYKERLANMAERRRAIRCSGWGAASRASHAPARASTTRSSAEMNNFLIRRWTRRPEEGRRHPRQGTDPALSRALPAGARGRDQERSPSPARRPPTRSGQPRRPTSPAKPRSR